MVSTKRNNKTERSNVCTYSNEKLSPKQNVLWLIICGIMKLCPPPFPFVVSSRHWNPNYKEKTNGILKTTIVAWMEARA